MIHRTIFFWGILFWMALSCSCTKTRRDFVDTSKEKSLDSPAVLDREKRPIIVAFGDSLTAGAGVDPAQNYPSKLQAKIDQSGYWYRVVNAGVSGETSGQGLSRIEAMSGLRPVIAIVELGANDGLRGLPIEIMRRNLSAIIEEFQSAGAKVILAGMEVPPNYGPTYAGSFRNVFKTLAKEKGMPLIPFFLEGVGGHPELNQDDGIHPNAEGYDVVVENVWKILKPML
jgi:acyl-CoA thioesterase-1